MPQFVHYAQKRFHLNLLAGAFADARPCPEIPGRAVSLSLLLGEVAQVPSFLQLEKETELPQWQRWVGYNKRISDDELAYVSERMDPQKLRRAATWINRKLKRGKAFEENKINGLLVVSLDANEQFCSDHRCCEDCLTREITTKDAQGQPVTRTQYYHQQVYAQISGPKLSVILDVEPMRQGEEECAAALRLLLRLRENYGPRFFDVVVVDAWYTHGPFHTEAVRVVRVRESWKERQRVGGKWVTQDKEENWIWVVAGELDGYGASVIRDVGHLRWKIENNAFNELTQSWHLTHCAHHHPVSLQVLLWIKLIAFTLFHAFALLHGKLFRLGKVTFQELRKRIYRSLLCGEVQPIFSG